MSKFQEMCEAADVALKNGLEWRDRCWSSLKLLVDEFIRYCEIPERRFELRPLNEEPETGMRYSVIGAAHWDTKDGYWHVGLVIALLPSRVLIELCLTEQAGKIMVKAGANGKPRELDLSEESERGKFYDELVEDIKRYFTAEPDFNETGSLKRIGFGSG